MTREKSLSGHTAQYITYHHHSSIKSTSSLCPGPTFLNAPSRQQKYLNETIRYF